MATMIGPLQIIAPRLICLIFKISKTKLAVFK